MPKGGKICDILDGKRKGQIAFVANDQEPEILKAKKVHAYFFDAIHNAILEDGKHANGIISVDKLKVTGFYD